MLSELSKPVAWVLHARGGDVPTLDECYVANAEGMESIHSSNLYSQEYVSALLAELEAKDQAHRVHAARLISERGVLRERVTELEAKLATPVRLPDPDENDYGYQSISYLQAIDAINDAGFTVEGDE